jgi:hypothetical protein
MLIMSLGLKKGGIMRRHEIGDLERTRCLSETVLRDTIRIYQEGEEPPDLAGFRRVDGLAVDAYRSNQGTRGGCVGSSTNLAGMARHKAVTLVARYYDLSDEDAYRDFEIVIVPSECPNHGRVYARRKVQK